MSARSMHQMRSPLLLLIAWGGARAARGSRMGAIELGHECRRGAQPQRLTEPAGASRCQVCHPSEVEEYSRSAMARSLRHASHEPEGKVEISDARITPHSGATGY